MQTGALLGLSLVTYVIGWLLVDGVVYLFGKQTFSKWVIGRSKESSKQGRLFGWSILLFLILLPLFLIFHFEIPEILISVNQ